MTSITLELPDELASQATMAGLFDARHFERLVRASLRGKAKDTSSQRQPNIKPTSAHVHTAPARPGRQGYARLPTAACHLAGQAEPGKQRLTQWGCG